MSGYREQGFDPSGRGESAPPLRPFTATQWFGLALLVLGALGIIIFILGRINVIPKLLDDAIPPASIMPLGAALMNARRHPASCDAQALRGRRIMAIVLALLAAIGGAVLAFLLAKGS